MSNTLQPDDSTRCGPPEVRSAPPTFGENAELVARLAAVRSQVEASSAHSSDLVLFFHPDGTIHSASHACRQVLDLEPEELIGANMVEIAHPDDRSRLAAELASIPHFGDSVRSEFRIVDPSGAIRWLEEIATNVVDNPNVGCLVGNLRDITERKVAEESVVFQARLLAAVGQAVIATNSDGEVTYWNDAAQSTYGWTAAEAIGQPISTILRPVPGWEEVTERIRPQIDEGKSWMGELWVQTKQGSTIPVQLTDTAIYDDTGSAVGTIGVSSNIARRLQSDASNLLLSAIVESSQDAIFSATEEGIVLTWNGGAARLFDRTPAETIGHHLSTVLPNGRADDVRHVFDEAIAGQFVDNFETRGRRSDGTDVNLSISVSPIRSPTGEIIGTSAIARDITERTHFIHQIEADGRRLAVAQASAMLGSFEINTVDGKVTRSDEMWRLLGRNPAPATVLAFDHVHPDDREQVQAFIGALAAGRDPIASEYRVLRPDGGIRWVLSRACRLNGQDAHIIAGTMLDITERHDAATALAYQATHDWLTDLPNQANLHAALSVALSTPAAGQVALAAIDLDHFKLINDQAGHPIGDQTLRAVADRLRAILPDSDVVARSGGDEYIAMRCGVDGMQGAHDFAVSITKAFAEPVQISDRQIEVTASIGVTLSTTADTPGSLLRDADDAMYQAKTDGRNRFTILGTASKARGHRRQDIAAALPIALDAGQFHLEYQPVIDLRTDEVAGFEALIRWNHPTLGVVRPDEFISVAEHSGLILPIGAWVLETAVAQLATWRADKRVPAELWMALNVSAHQLSQPTFVASVAAVVESAHVPPHSIHLEITESILMNRIENALSVIADLQTTGIKVSIDDFGTGYSSLSYLSRLPVNTIKIDRSFVSGLGNSTHGTSIVRAMMTLASTLELDVVAEGVEQESQLALLQLLSCTFGQGYHWSPSMEPAAAMLWMIERGAQPARPRSPITSSLAKWTPPDGGDVGRAMVDVALIRSRDDRPARDLIDLIQLDALEIGIHARKLWIAGREVELTVKEFDLLAFLVTRQGHVFDRATLLREVWDSSPDWQTTATVTEHIHRLRYKIEADPSRPLLLFTVRNLGYRLGAALPAAVEAEAALC